MSPSATVGTRCGFDLCFGASLTISVLSEVRSQKPRPSPSGASLCRLPLILLCIELLAFSLPLPLALVRLRIRKPTQPASAATPTPYFDTCRTLELLPPSTPQLFTLASQRHPAGSSSSFNDRPVPSHHRRRSSAGSHSLSEVRAGNLLSIHPRTANQAQLSPIVGTSSHRRLPCRLPASPALRHLVSRKL